ncbi:hypothetical protein C475_05090 [Halosimplex carlsbadense 2-9-1]|uniref:Uncharacterized protein n=1 Tax=Halosimplex carlsbadense 2-9-1 TaxID=797114 RepID=M0CZV2_9EURY|nr:hypothetical protein C475_05090 [Halosimplex carlsbadense 2-9-1]
MSLPPAVPFATVVSDGFGVSVASAGDAAVSVGRAVSVPGCDAVGARSVERSAVGTGSTVVDLGSSVDGVTPVVGDAGCAAGPVPPRNPEQPASTATTAIATAATVLRCI